MALFGAAGISPTLILNQNGKTKRKEGGSFSKFERQKLKRLYANRNAAYGLVHNFLKTSNLPVSKLGQFLFSKRSYTEVTLATQNFKRMKAIASFKTELWSMDLSYVGKRAKDQNGGKHLPDFQDMFDTTVDAKGMKTKYSHETVCAFLTMVTKKNRPKKQVDKTTDFAGEFKKLCKAEGLKIYSRKR